MKSVWKWVLGIVLVLILCAAVGGTFLAFNHRYALRAVPIVQADQPGKYAWSMPMHRGFDGPNTPYHQRPFHHGMYPRMGLRGGYGLMPYGGGFMFFGGLIRLFVPLLILGLVAFGAYQFGKRAAVRTATPSPVVPAPPVPEDPEKGGEESPQ